MRRTAPQRTWMLFLPEQVDQIFVGNPDMCSTYDILLHNMIRPQELLIARMREFSFSLRVMLQFVILTVPFLLEMLALFVCQGAFLYSLLKVEGHWDAWGTVGAIKCGTGPSTHCR